jgi:membrane-bound lytic murein transglycosylase F
VAKKHIDITIANSNIALLNRRYYPQIIISGPISEKESLGWAVDTNADRLRGRINAFFKTIKKNGKFERIYNKYYGNVDTFDYADLKRFHKRLKTRLPRHYQIIKEAAEKHGFDWRLIAAQTYQESHLNPEAISQAGAYGLMQLTPSTAQSLGVTNILEPRQNVNAGVRYLKNLYDHFDRANGTDRLLMALAAYNIGQGHIFDARNIAKRMNLDPNQWSAVAKVLPLLRFRQYYKKAKYGYCRGTEPIRYIKQIMLYYDVLKHQSIEFQSMPISSPAEALSDTATVVLQKG